MRTFEQIAEYKKQWRIKDKLKHLDKYKSKALYRRGEHPNSRNGFKNGHPKTGECGAPKGSHNSPATEFKKGQFTDEKHPFWKGEKSSYTAKHQWIRRKLGSPKKCSHCGTTEDRVYHWANISNKYKHEITDWVRLCVPCHKKYDNEKRNK